MRYVSWAAFYEGSSDGLYLDVLLPRVIRDLVARDGIDLVEVPEVPAVRLGLQSRSVQDVAREACNFRDAFDVVFIHADTGGRGVERGIELRADAYCTALAVQCQWPAERCITVTPRHMTEAWILADGAAVTSALGYGGAPREVGLPQDPRAAERLDDPKHVLRNAVEIIAGRRRRERIQNIYAAVAQRQDLDQLRRTDSYRQFEHRLRRSLRAMGCIA